MAFHFSYSQEDLRKEIDDLERTKGDQIKSYCETTDCERYLSGALAQLESIDPTPTSWPGAPGEELPTSNSNNYDWEPKRKRDNENVSRKRTRK
jgi:hypothetical protein